MRKLLKPHNVYVPKVYSRYCTPRVLVLEFIDGTPVRQAPDVPERREADR